MLVLGDDFSWCLVFSAFHSMLSIVNCQHQRFNNKTPWDTIPSHFLSSFIIIYHFHKLYPPLSSHLTPHMTAIKRFPHSYSVWVPCLPYLSPFQLFGFCYPKVLTSLSEKSKFVPQHFVFKHLQFVLFPYTVGFEVVFYITWEFKVELWARYHAPPYITAMPLKVIH